MSRLPEGWEDGLTPRQARRVLEIEEAADLGEFNFIAPNGKGYAQVYLTPHHPYANSSGCQLLHRYIAMRHLGRALETWEHVHHRRGAEKDTTALKDLQICEAVTHDLYHYGVRIRCGIEVDVWKPRDESGRFTPYPSDEDYEEIFRQFHDEVWGNRPAGTVPL